MKFPLEAFRQTKNREKLLELLKTNICDNCLGRQWGMVGHGMDNAERGKILRKFASEITKSRLKEPDICQLCDNFFKDEINKLANSIVKKLEDVEFDTFLIGTILSSKLARKQNELWEKIGIEDIESIKSEINREVGKRVEKLSNKKFSLKNPDITIIVDLDENRIKPQIRSLYVFGKYQKLARGMPQTKWLCPKCRGKGCTYCKGEGKLYKTSVQEEIEKPFLKLSKSKQSRFHGAGREDIDARNLDFRPFVLELIKPQIRHLDLKEIGKLVNRSKKVQAKNLKITTKDLVKKIKFARIDKTYRCEVIFGKKNDKKKLKLLKQLVGKVEQKTPQRVLHRRSDKIRRRILKTLKWKILGSKKLELVLKAESGLYIKELVSGDQGRTKPSVADILDNEVKRISLDVIKIHSKI